MLNMYIEYDMYVESVYCKSFDGEPLLSSQS